MIQLREHEKVLSVFRRHWLVLALAIAQVMIAMVVAVFLPALINLGIPGIVENYREYITLGSTLIIQCLLITLFFIVADYYLDSWIITSERLVFIELKGLFSRTVTSMELENIQDISVEVHGILETVFKFGDVRIQSAGAAAAFVFKQVRHPYAVKDMISSARGNTETNQ
ncbi:MAG: PH domain-containing protein [Patescibacteria group bacterium]